MNCWLIAGIGLAKIGLAYLVTRMNLYILYFIGYLKNSKHKSFQLRKIPRLSRVTRPLRNLVYVSVVPHDGDLHLHENL